MGSCSVDKYLQPGQKVLYRNEVNVVMADSSKVTPEVSEALSNVRQFYYQTPNKRFLFMPLRMRLYCSTNPDDSSGWSNFWRSQGEAPVVYDPLAAQRTAAQIATLLKTKGCFNSTVTVDTARMIADSACDFYRWYGDTIRTTGIYGYNDINTSTGCVTYRSINLKIKPLRKPVKDTAMVGCNSIIFTVSSLVGSTSKRFYVDTLFDTNLIDRRWARCYDSTIHLNVTVHKSGYDSTYVNACDSFYWELNRRTYHNTPTTNPTYAFATDTFNCDSMMVLFLTINPSPVISAINGEWHLNPGDTAVLYPTCTNGASYLWKYNNHTFNGDTLRIPNVNGNIDVELIASINYTANNNVCSDTSWITIVSFVGIDQVQGTNVSLYPNPTVGQLNVESAEAIREVAIFNTLGQQVLTNYNLGNKGQMNLSNLSKGTYTMRIALQNGETVVRKFVITK